MEGILKKAYDAKWLIFGLALILLLIWVAWPFLTVIVYGIFVYYVAKPIKRKLRRYIKNDTLLVFACMFLLVLPFIVIVGYTLLLAVSQMNAVVAGVGIQSLPGGPLTNMSNSITLIGHNVSTQGLISGNLTAELRDLWDNSISGYSGSIISVQQLAVSTGMTALDIVFKVFLMLVIAFYLLRDDGRIKAWFAQTFPLLMAEHGGLLAKYYKAVDEDLEKIFFGNIISIVFFAIVAAFIFSLLNAFAPSSEFVIPYAILLGILCGAAALLPVVGMYLVTIPLFLYILVRSLSAGTLLPHLWFFVLMAVVVVIFVQTLPEFVLRPFIARGKVNTGLLMFAYVLGPVVFGIAGLFIGAILLVLVTHYFTTVVPELTGEYKPD